MLSVSCSLVATGDGGGVGSITTSGLPKPGMSHGLSASLLPLTFLSSDMISSLKYKEKE